MKRPQPDIGDILKASFINDMGSARKFKRLWGTTYVGGVEVLKDRQYYYPSSYRASNFEKLFKFLGAYNDVTASNPKGVSSAWIYLNKNKGSKLPAATPTELDTTYNDFVAYNLNQMWWDDNDGAIPEGLTITTSIVIEALIDTSRDTTVATTSLLSPNWPTEQLISAIQSNYDTLWDTCLISQQGVGVINKGSITDEVSNVVTPDEDDLSPDDPWLAGIARHALRSSSGVNVTIKDVEIGYGKNEAGRLYPTYVLEVEIPYTEFTTDSSLVALIVSDLLADYSSKTRKILSYPNGYWTKQEITAMDSSDLEEDPNIITRPYRLFEDEAVENDPRYTSIWYNYGGTYYLKADVFSNPKNYGLTFRDLYGYVVSLIDSGYKKKKVKWYKKALALVIFVVYVVLLQPQIGYAAAIALASTILLALTLVFALLGMDDWATAFAEVNKALEPLVIVATIVTMVQGFKKLAEEAAKDSVEEMIKARVEDFVEKFIQNIVQGAKDLVGGNLTGASLEFANKLTKLLTLPSQIRLEELNSRNKDLKTEYEQLVQEMSRETDVLKGFARIYAKPATADWSMYAATFDQPYERGGGPLHIGNIQRTTKQALRKADYNEPVFDNILVV